MNKGDNHLYVPVILKGMMVGKLPQGDWYTDISDDFKRLIFSALGEDVPSQLTSMRQVPKGVHLHWSLPDALTQGIQRVDKAGQGDVVYPPVPNRWLLTRLWLGKGGDDSEQASSRSWVIEGDALFPSRRAELGNLGSPSRPELGDLKQPYRYLGRSYPAEGTAPPQPAEILSPLTAVAPGNPTYTAYYPTCRNVFGLYDDMTDLAGRSLTNVNLSYSLCGWYGDTTQDPLVGISNAEECMEKLSWRPPVDTSFPARTICQGMLCGMEWTDGDTDYSAQIPLGLKKPEVAVGNTSAEALAALLAWKEPAIRQGERMLQHLMTRNHTLAANQDSLMEAEKRLHDARFGSQSPVRRLTLSGIGEEAATREPDQRTAALLAQVNVLYEELAQGQYALSAQQEQVYDLWYRYMLISAQRPSAKNRQLMEECQNRIKELANPINRQKNAVKALEKQIEEQEGELVRSVNSLFEISYLSGQRYWKPGNIVLLLANVPRSFSHGLDGRFSEDGLLKVRDKVISTMTVQSIPNLLDQTVAISAAELLSGPPAADACPSGSGPVMECLLLSPSFSALIARHLIKKTGRPVEETKVAALAQQIAKLQAALTGPALYKDFSSMELSQAAGMDADFPDKNAVEYWQQPWFPLYLEWQARYYPDPELIAQTPSLKNWTRRGTDFVYTGPDISADRGMAVSGRIVITPHGAVQLSEAAQKALGDTLGTENLSVLSQSLSGLHEQMMMQDLELQFPLFDFADGNPQLARDTGILLTGYQPERPLFDTLFSPIRGGYLVINNLYLIDSFGQFQDIDLDGCAVSDNLRDHETIFQKRIMLPPRHLQPLRINFEWRPAAADFPGSPPICGWLVPSLLESSLLVFDPDGQLLGSLQRIGDKALPVVWKQPPETGGKTAELPPDINNELRAFLSEILRAAREDQTDLLSDLLSSLDQSLWNTNPASLQHNVMGVYLGRPLALVQANIRLEPMHPPRAYKSLDLLSPPPPFSDVNVEQTSFQVRIGQREKHNDGVIGFFVDHDYRTLYLGVEQVPAKPYFSKQGWINLHPRWDGHPTALTLLMDPMGEINFDSGILPVKTIRIDDAVVSRALEKLYHTVLTAPVLAVPGEFSLPFPSLEAKEWHWIGFSGSGQWEEITDLQRSQARPFFSAAQAYAREGWLKLRKADVEEE
ncbi:hypothetical protein NVS47_09365 [Dehalobacterium formicoaceticum]|uniref:Uncharacterized protein n=1 Tax=Dehalobacterium formicoaceticum TaxID=51515 RepID=A0ABT1Y4B3_9FIRM|nr:hypothetical protein [Dehalobacterium formicoaceticum]MCR6545714.1 hypothetical protein [Dehalobacterium formicoaceticum]